MLCFNECRVLGAIGYLPPSKYEHSFRNSKIATVSRGVIKLLASGEPGAIQISRAGHAAAQKALYMPGLVAKHHNPVIMAMAKRLEGRGLAPKAIVGASMRRLVHVIYGVINSGKSFDMAIAMRALAFQDGI